MPCLMAPAQMYIVMVVGILGLPWGYLTHVTRSQSLPA